MSENPDRVSNFLAHCLRHNSAWLVELLNSKLSRTVLIHRAISRLLKVVQTPHAITEICRKASLTLESLASEPQNRAILMSYENSFVEVALTDVRMSDIFARILFELSSGTHARAAPVRGVWGS